MTQSVCGMEISMNELLVELLNRSIQASILIAAVIILRLVFKRVPKWTICLLWGLVAIRLACPFTVESPYSLGIKEDVIRVDAGTGVGSADAEVLAQGKQENGQNQSNLQAQKGQFPVQKRQSSVQGQSDLQEQTAQTREQQQGQIDRMKTEQQGQTDRVKREQQGQTDQMKNDQTKQQADQGKNQLQEHTGLLKTKLKTLNQWYQSLVRKNSAIDTHLLHILTIIWGIGVLGMAVYAVLSYLRVYRCVRMSVPVRENIYLCDEIQTPFILGVVRPRIYLPSAIGETEQEHVLLHERAHLQRKDYLWKPLGFVLLIAYWFQPLCWIAYALFCVDIEIACDERVIRNMDPEHKKIYSSVLLSMSVPDDKISVCPLAFGETGVKQRIQSVLHYQKPKMGSMAAIAVAGMIVAGLFMTSPQKKENTAQAKADATPAATVMSKKSQRKQTTLTIQMLAKMAAADDWEQKQREGSISDWEGYSNLQKSDTFSRDSLTDLLYGQLSYQQTMYELDIYYWKKSDGATAKKADSIDMITLCNTVHDDMIVLYDAERGQTTPDLTTFLQKKYKVPNALKKGNINSRKLKGKVTLGTYTTDLFLDFAGCLFQNKRYTAPKHGENTPEAWYSLGGAGVSDSTENAVFQQGQLTEYHYLANHMGSRKITDVVTGKYTGCLYRYTLDLATAAEAESLRKEERTADYWVLFYTTGEGQPVYMKFFNGKYYSAKDALNSIG